MIFHTVSILLLIYFIYILFFLFYSFYVEPSFVSYCYSMLFLIILYGIYHHLNIQMYYDLIPKDMDITFFVIYFSILASIITYYNIVVTENNIVDTFFYGYLRSQIGLPIYMNIFLWMENRMLYEYDFTWNEMIDYLFNKDFIY